jgi:hypothetical protein
MTSAFESTQHDLTFTAEGTPQRDLAFPPAITTKTVMDFRRLLPVSMIALGAVASVGWAGLLLWLLFQIVLAII